MQYKPPAGPFAQAARTDDDHRLRGTHRKLRVLIVEDNALIAMDHTALIEYLGGEVVGVVDTDEAAIASASTLRPDTVLIDVELNGDIDGIDAAARIGAVCVAAIIFATARSDPATTRRMQLVSNHLPVVKPIGVATLRDALVAAGFSRGLDPLN